MTVGPVAWTLLTMVVLGGAMVDAATTQVEEGKHLYRIHCQACHGESARGDGSMKDRLDTAPPDLTTIARRHQGDFPRDKVQEIIDGRHETSTHGSREMPVWGFTFQTSGLDSDQEEVVRGMVTALTRYLETIQSASSSEPDNDVPKN